MRSRWMTYFLLLILSVQLLPVKEWGRMLYNNTVQEEICEPMESGEQVKNSSDETFSYINCFYTLSIHDATIASNRRLRSAATRLCAHFPSEIPTPPPLFSV
jgi:hypothetical protein